MTDTAMAALLGPDPSSRPRVFYLAGPMTGFTDFNRAAFAATADRLRTRDRMVVLSPAEHLGGDTSLDYAWYMRAAIQSLLLCDNLIRMPGWQRSRGARLEVAIAEALGMPIHDFGPEYIFPPLETTE